MPTDGVFYWIPKPDGTWDYDFLLFDPDTPPYALWDGHVRHCLAHSELWKRSAFQKLLEAWDINPGPDLWATVRREMPARVLRRKSIWGSGPHYVVPDRVSPRIEELRNCDNGIPRGRVYLASGGWTICFGIELADIKGWSGIVKRQFGLDKVVVLHEEVDDCDQHDRKKLKYHGIKW